MEMVTNFVGVDVASRWLDICLHNGSVERIDNSLTAITEWVASLPRATAIAMEATGRYHSLLASVAFQHGHTVYVLNPRAVYHYAAGIGRRQKSDKADAAIIRRYLSNEHDSLKPWRPATANQELIKMLTNHRASVVRHRQAISMTCKSMPVELTMLNDALEALKKLIDELEKKIMETMKNEDPEQQEGFKAMKSIPGFGALSSAFFSNEMARGDFKSGDQFIAFFGLDLQFKDSGTKRGRRRLSKQGSSEGRRLLYNVAMSACRGAFKPMYEHYTSRMSCTQALVAVMRKLLRIAFSVWRSKKAFDMAMYRSPVMQSAL
ncbi:transposase [Endozoicomonas sp. SCSIO W0465]|uniref:IS110 family transposase n=3 Tax=Endozoicomonas sp. SCSIO W0465 TaxID=2918516 RepID=UPI0020762DB7|nr:transposase [Endozoicomonas sp. SCSIO W0465]USE36099.1 transposase [Endozoicomonas sp. SCSIO W0465]USE38277.1 transposase [Endozoicomonas sp. SCSIO W0465]